MAGLIFHHDQKPGAEAKRDLLGPSVSCEAAAYKAGHLAQGGVDPGQILIEILP